MIQMLKKVKNIEIKKIPLLLKKMFENFLIIYIMKDFL